MLGTTAYYALLCHMKKHEVGKVFFLHGHKPRDGKPSASIGHRSLCCFRIFQVRAWRDKNVQFRTIGLGLGWCAWVSDVGWSGAVSSCLLLQPQRRLKTVESFQLPNKMISDSKAEVQRQVSAKPGRCGRREPCIASNFVLQAQTVSLCIHSLSLFSKCRYYHTRLQNVQTLLFQ